MLTKKKALTPDQKAALEKDIELLGDIRKQEKMLKIQIHEVQDRVIALQPEKEYITESGIKSTIVQKVKMTIFEDILKKKVGAAMWNKITTKALDRKKLDAFVASGEITSAVLAESSETNPESPYATITKL